MTRTQSTLFTGGVDLDARLVTFAAAGERHHVLVIDCGRDYSLSIHEVRPDQLETLAQRLLVIAREMRGDTPTADDNASVPDALPVGGTRVRSTNGRVRLYGTVRDGDGCTWVLADDGQVHPYDATRWECMPCHQ